jgi:phosphoglycerol transferase MdoB-like AlkP superfamily enzyme
MKNAFSHLFLLLRRLAIVLLVYSFSRVLFFLLNHDLFASVGMGRFLLMLVAGLRFDITAIIYINLLFILLSLLPIPQRSSAGYQTGIKWIFILTNSIGFAFSTIDMAYYRFTLKRSTFDLFNFISAGDDTQRLLPTFIKEYWYLFFVFAGMIWFTVWAYKRTKRFIPSAEPGLQSLLKNTLVLALGTGLAVLGIRGGFQLIPITIVSAAQYTSVENIPLVLNTPFTILKSWDQDLLEEKTFFTETELRKIIDPIHPADTGSFRKMNVMVIMMESFSKEYVGALSHKKTCTPFLDSLIQVSLVFDNAYANAKKSIEGIPAILAGIPCMSNEAFITSPYGTNKFTSFANLLASQGYNSTFYHGASNGSMSFDDFCGAAGFSNYYGRTEYGKDKDYDGNWGVWDEEFFLKVADKMNEQPQPFLSALFTLTSHHPFPVPEKYKGKFPDDGILPIHKSISYTDHCLEEFFEKASKMPWYRNTLFVLTADHTGPSLDPFFANRVGNFQVPLIFFAPGDTALKGINRSVVQHIDILPTVMHYLHYNKPYFAFGEPVDLVPGVSDEARFAVNYNSSIYAVIGGEWQLQFDGEKSLGLFQFDRDSTLQNDLLNKGDPTQIMSESERIRLRQELEDHVKAMIQLYNQSLLKNEMMVK